jgi:N-acetylglutamate synthase-like GNAT family acetyltransferase
MDEIAVREARFDEDAVQALLAEWDRELGFAPKGGTTVEATDFEPPRGVFLVAERQRSAVGCGGLRRISPTTAEVKRLFVSPRQRGNRIGRTLLAHLERHAAEQGLLELRLDTPGGSSAALALFRASGFSEIPDYNGNPHARHWFAKPLTVAE